MITNGSKVRILENFYSLDYVLFGKPLREMDFKCVNLVEDYLATKSALLSTLMEIFSLIDHSPKLVSEGLNSNAIKEMAKSSAILARENCKKLVTTDKARNNIKISLRENLEENSDVDINKFVQEKIREKAFGLAIDNLLIARTLTESKDLKKLNNWSGRIVEDAYKILRNSLVESAMKLLYECPVGEMCDKEHEKENKKKDKK